MQKRIFYHDTDCGGVVYYANYLKYMEEARTEFMAEKGALIKDLADQGVMFVVAHQEIDYKLPAFYGDVLDVKARIIGMSTVKMEYEHEVKNQSGQVVCVGKAVLVCVDKNIKPRPIPEELRIKFN